MNIKLVHGNCLEKLKDMEDASVDAVVTDPPAGISFMDKSWDSDKGGRDHWIVWLQEIMEECYRVLRPGAHVVVWALPRTSHWTRMAIDNAGFEIRHVIEHIYSSGFPKGQNIGKAYDKRKRRDREVLREEKKPFEQGGTVNWDMRSSKDSKLTKGNSEWEGFGTALKPAHEDWILARKPLSEKTIVENCIKHGTGALNIDGCRISTQDAMKEQKAKGSNGGEAYGDYGLDATYVPSSQGRFPSDVIVSDDALNDGVVTKSSRHLKCKAGKNKGLGKSLNSFKNHTDRYGGHNDTGLKSRYFDLDVWAEKNGIFYCPKPGPQERGEDNEHSTVKPSALMSWLITLVSKPGDTVLDPFMGSGTTGIAAKKLSRNFIGIERDQNYFEIAKKRIKEAQKIQRQVNILEYSQGAYE